jgi:hypothetical protein
VASSISHRPVEFYRHFFSKGASSCKRSALHFGATSWSHQMILGKEAPELTARQMQAVSDSFNYADWEKRDHYARLDAKACYDSALRELGFPADQRPL